MSIELALVILVLVAWTILGDAIMCFLISNTVMPTTSSLMNIVVATACGPFVWITLLIMFTGWRKEEIT